jgi:tRNA nucleotidyltransferase/poly(A) polymerase
MLGDNIHENEKLFPSVNPTVMEDVEIPLPPEIDRFSQSFKLDSLKDIQHELVSPGKPNKHKIGHRLSDMSFKARQDLKKKGVLQVTGRKLYVTGGIVRDWLINHFHGIAYPADDWDLATDASPDALKLIVQAAIEAKQLPPDTKLTHTDNKKFGNMKLTVGQKEFEITTFPFAQYEGAPRMYLDSVRRNFSPNALYYSIDERKIYDYSSGITDIYRRQPNFIGKVKRRLKDEDSMLQPMVYARLHARMNGKGPEGLEKAARGEIKKYIIPHNAPRHSIHDEFTKGIKSALNKEKYIEILDDLGLLKQIFPGLKVDAHPHLGDLTIFPMVVAELLKHNRNNLEHAHQTLLGLDFPEREVHDIIFLLKLPLYDKEDEFKHDRMHSGLSDRSLEQFVKATHPHNASWLTSVIKGTKAPVHHKPTPAQPAPTGVIGHLTHYAHKAADAVQKFAGLSGHQHPTHQEHPHEAVDPILAAARRVVESNKNR